VNSSTMANPNASFSLRRTGLIACLATLLVLASVASAPAAFKHNQNDPPFEVGCSNISDIAVDEANGWVYVACEFPDAIRRFTLTGTPANFSFSAPYVSGNAITGNPGADEGETSISGQSRLRIEVDNSSSPNQGLLFVTATPDISVFRPTGEYGFPLNQPIESTISNYLDSVDVGPDGSIYVFSAYPGGRISKYTPQMIEVKRLYTFSEAFGFVDAHIQVDSHGAMWASHNDYHDSNTEELRKYEPDQFTDELKPKLGTGVDPSFEAKLSPFVVPNPLLAGGTVSGLDVDPNTDDIYVARGNRVEAFTRGTSSELSYKRLPDFGVGVLTNSRAVAVTDDNHVYASTAGNKVVRFGPGDVIPDVHTLPPNVDEVGHKGATLRAEVELDAANGGTAIEDCKLEFGETTAYGSVQQCTPDATISNFNSDTEVSAATGETLDSGTPYHYRFVAENEKGINHGADKTFVPAFVLKTETQPATELELSGGKASAKLNASFDPDGLPTQYKFQYNLDGNYGGGGTIETSFADGGSGIGVVEKGTVVTDLPPGTEFHYRVVTKNGEGETVGGDRTFRTATTPDISGVRTTDVTETSAVLNASINPSGFATDYHFEYGTTTALGQLAPATPVAIGAGGAPVAVSQKIENLQPGFTYHFRVVAENQWGQSASDDTTFDFAPPSCPNDHVRQQTRSAYLPDCRAYELVSPGSAGAAILLPSDLAATGGGFQAYGESSAHINNLGFATSPSRFAFWGTLSSLAGTETTVESRDMYMATRTNNGWVTKTPSYHNNDAFLVRRQICSKSMDLCAVHNVSQELGFKSESSPAVFDYEGKLQMRLPTNLAAIEASAPNARQFYGGQAFSPDFSHFVFSSDNVPFVAGGVLGGIGSAYDNDISERSVEIISKRPNGDDIPAEAPLVGGLQKDFDFRVSGDGSHILMDSPAPPGAGPNRFLYMRVGGGKGITYDISLGNPVVPIGMTRSGDKVLFTTAGQMPGSGDTDTSVDLYAWSEETDESTLLSQGNGNGNSDTCNAGWGVSNCGVRPLTPERMHPNNNLQTSFPGQDDQFADITGDVYFYSPELLDPARPGIFNQRNLYLYREGAVHLVDTFDAGTEVERSQVSPDGSHAAFLTSSKMTPYDNAGLDQVYAYDADTGVIRCASCNPTGAPPTKDVEVSQGGRFMTDDGRAFFATADSLVPRDQNGFIIDIYEYVDGRPQLISSGLAGNDYTGGSEVVSLFLPAVYIGLEHVSRDGADVYFSSFDTLVDEDLNGEYVKFYDARTGGGFPPAANLGPCAAADECHGPDSSPPTPPTVTSDSNFGKGGNVVPEKQSKKKKKKGKKKKKSKAKKRAHRQGGRSNG
jgi:hypothetical protein